MSVKVAIQHQMHYDYADLIFVSPQIIRLKPAAHTRTPILAYSLQIEPDNHFINWQQDPFGNFLARVVFSGKIKKLHVNVEVVAEMVPFNPFGFFVEFGFENFPFQYEVQLQKELNLYFEITENGSLLKDFIVNLQGIESMPVTSFLGYLNQALLARVQYSVRMEPGVQTCEETLGRGVGSCRDSAWLLVQVCRHLGLAARFVSGYLVQLSDGTDFTGLHAWAEVFVPGAGWVGLDPTSGLFAGEGHIPLSCTPSPGSAAPITGMIDPVETIFSFKNEVFRL